MMHGGDSLTRIAGAKSPLLPRTHVPETSLFLRVHHGRSAIWSAIVCSRSLRAVRATAGERSNAPQANRSTPTRCSFPPSRTELLQSGLPLRTSLINLSSGNFRGRTEYRNVVMASRNLCANRALWRIRRTRGTPISAAMDVTV